MFYFHVLRNLLSLCYHSSPDKITKRPVICSTSTSFVICFRYAIIVPPTSCKICWGNHASGSSLSNLCCSCFRFTSPCFAICFQLYLSNRPAAHVANESDKELLIRRGHRRPPFGTLFVWRGSQRSLCLLVSQSSIHI